MTLQSPEEIRIARVLVNDWIEYFEVTPCTPQSPVMSRHMEEVVKYARYLEQNQNQHQQGMSLWQRMKNFFHGFWNS